MVDLGCQDTDWFGGSERDVLDTILLWNGLILAPFSINKGKCCCLGCISGWFGAMRGALRVKEGGLSVLKYSVGGWK